MLSTLSKLVLVALQLLLWRQVSASASSAAAGCRVQQDWEHDTAGSLTVWPLLVTPQCEVLAVNRTHNGSVYISGIDAATGERRWSWLLHSPRGNQGPNPIIPTADPSLLYTLAFDIEPMCGPLLYVSWNLTKVRYEPGSGLTTLWQAQLGCLTQASVQVFPATAASSERVLVWAEPLLMLDGETGEQLYNRTAPMADVSEVARVGNGSSHQLALLSRPPDSDDLTLASYELGADAHWKQLASVSIDGAAFQPVQTEDIMQQYETRGRVWALQSLFDQALLLGVDALTGRQAWSSDNNPLLTGKWAARFPGFYADLADLVPHPSRPDWLLVTSDARNSSGFVISAFALLDSSTGKTLAMPPPTAPVFYGMDWGWDVLWTATAGVVYKTLLAAQTAFYVALDADSLRLISMGPFTPSTSADALFLGAQADGASIVYALREEGEMRGARLPAFNTTQAAAGRRTAQRE